MGIRRSLPFMSVALVLGACSQGSRQADQLDNAANQADPAAATVMHNEADQIRENGSDTNLSAAGSPVQSAMQNAGDAASTTNQSPAVANAAAPADTSNAGAKPHHAGDPVPPPQRH